MAAIKGRSIKVTRNNVTLAGVRTKSLSINGSPIDVTNDDDEAVRKLLDQPGQVEVSISVSGILTSDQLRQEALSASNRVQAMTFTVPGAPGSPDYDLFSGNFFMSSYAETGEYQGAATFEAEFQSAGAVTVG